jgi:cytochrome P450
MYWGLLKNVVTARRVITRIVESRQSAEKESSGDYEKPTDILQGMLDGAKGEEMSLANLSQRMLILSLASIHTTALTMTQTLYDLCEHPEYFEPIREELVRVLREDGGWGKTTLNKLWKLDSLIKESQRFSPVFMRKTSTALLTSYGDILANSDIFASDIPTYLSSIHYPL